MVNTTRPVCHWHSLLECKNLLPIVLHANDCPAVLLRLVIQRLRERADFGVVQSLSGTVRILSLCIVVQHEHRDPRAVARFGVFEHLLVAGRIAERGERPAPNHQMDAFELPGVVVVQQQLRFFRQERLPL